MRITPISYNFTTRKANTNGKNYLTYQPINKNDVCPISIVNSVSFMRSAKNAEVLRKLMEYNIPDMYSGKTILNPKDMEKLVSSHVFSGPISKVVEAILPHEDCLHDVERKVFSIIKAAAQTRPNAQLAEIIDDVAPLHYARLRYIQTPVFKQLKTLARDLPDEARENFKNLMALTAKKLNNESVVQPFSAKEFNYKLKRISEEVEAGNNFEEISTMNSIMHIAQKMPEKTKEDIMLLNNISSKAHRNKKLRTHQSLVRQRGESLKQIEALYLNSPLCDNFELGRILAQTRARIFNIPTKTAFNRKSFIYELKKITDSVEDTKLAHKIIKTALKLPTSHEDISAFIVKAADYSSAKIGYNLIAASEGSIEHLIPYVKDGHDLISNYGLSSKYYNSERSDMPMAHYLRRNPKVYNNCQKQVDRLIELYNNGTFDKIGLSKWYIINFVQQMYKLSPPEKRMVLSLQNLAN